jgi:DNA polymerase III delta prime subunit
VFIISCVSILHEAQNALLKLFEEPNAHTLFYFIIPRMDMLLPTLRSRLNVLGIEERGVMHSEVRDFFSASYANRLALIAKKIDAEDTSWIQSLIESLAGYAHTSKQQSLIRDILLLESYVHAAGSSKKMLLEHVALTFPEKIIV